MALLTYRIPSDKFHDAYKELANTSIEDHEGYHHVSDLDAASFDTHAANKEDPSGTCVRLALQTDGVAGTLQAE